VTEATTAVQATLNYVAATTERPIFHANDSSLDRLPLDPHVVPIGDARTLSEAPTLACEGIELVSHASAVTDFRDGEEVAQRYGEEIRSLIEELTGADFVAVTGPGVLRFSERSAEAGTRDNSRAARFVHSDVSGGAAVDFAHRAAPPGRRFRRIAQHNIWRTFSGPPQDAPLAVCDARSVLPNDLVPAEARFDRDGRVNWSFEALLLRYNPAHRWLFFADMRPDEVLVFKRYETAPNEPLLVPHSAFTHPGVGPDAPPRASIEMRTVAYWFA
jgi:hypothetical protein